jgi:dihydroorotate dehydrogenase electron transfer subunit
MFCRALREQAITLWRRRAGVRIRMRGTGKDPSAVLAAEIGPDCRAAAFPIEETCARVISNHAVNPEYFHLSLVATPGMLAAVPGQFFHLQCPGGNGDSPLLRRPMSIYRINANEQRIEFLYKVTGAGTRGLSRLAAGDALNVLGPLGRGFQLRAPLRHVLFAARGVGMATMAPLAEAGIGAGARVTGVLSARNADLVMSEDYLRFVGATTHVVTDEAGTSAAADIEILIRRIHDRQPIDLLATCGSNRLLQVVKSLASDLNIAGQVALEQHMGCALGMCFCCVRAFRIEDKITYRRVCFEGPVFDVRETISW